MATMLSHQDKQVTPNCDLGLIPADERRECTHLSIKITADRQRDTEFLGLETALSLTQYYYHNFVKRGARINSHFILLLPHYYDYRPSKVSNSLPNIY